MEAVGKPGKVGKAVLGLKIEKQYTANCSSYEEGEDAIDHVICHTPEGSFEGTVRYLLTPGVQASYDYLISEDGQTIIQLVPSNKKAWHALRAHNWHTEAVSASPYAGRLSRGAIDTMARLTAWRLSRRGLAAAYEPTGSSLLVGYARHGDLQPDRSDPGPRAWFRRDVVPLVRDYYREFTR